MELKWDKNAKKADVTCRCGTVYKSDIQSIFKADSSCYITKEECPECKDNKNVKHFVRIL